MTYFNAVAQVQDTVTGDDGKVRQAHKCVTCSLVWGSKALAIACAVRNHRNRYVVEYTREHLIDGKLSLVELTFLRQAMRRDGDKPAGTGSAAEVKLQAPAQSGPAAPPSPSLELSLAALKALAAEQGYRLSKIPAPKPQKPPVTEDEPLDELYDDMAPAF